MVPLFTLPPTCRHWIPTGSISTFVSLSMEITATLHLNLPLGVANEEHYFSAIKLISGAIAGDSTLQDRGVAHYLLSLLFSLVSLPYRFYLSVLYRKPQKNYLPCFF